MLVARLRSVSDHRVGLGRRIGRQATALVVAHLAAGWAGRQSHPAQSVGLRALARLETSRIDHQLVGFAAPGGLAASRNGALSFLAQRQS